MDKRKETNNEQPRYLEIPDAQIKDAADQFEAVRKLLDKQPVGSGVLLPMMNCAAMAIELYLKSLAAVRIYTPIDKIADKDEKSCDIYNVTAESYKRGHKLVPLFETIDKDIRKEIEQLFTEQNPKVKALFKEMLEKCEGILEVSRYPFEKGKKISRYNNNIVRGCSELLSCYVNSLMKREKKFFSRVI